MEKHGGKPEKLLFPNLLFPNIFMQITLKIIQEHLLLKATICILSSKDLGGTIHKIEEIVKVHRR